MTNLPDSLAALTEAWLAEALSCTERANQIAETDGPDDYYVGYNRGFAAAFYRMAADKLNRQQAPPAPSGALGEPVAWTEFDGEEWVVYGAESKTGQHIRDFQKDRHFKEVFPIYAHPTNWPQSGPYEDAPNPLARYGTTPAPSPVAVEVTDEMRAAGFESEAWDNLMEAVCKQKWWPYSCRESAECVEGIYRAMLAAAKQEPRHD